MCWRRSTLRLYGVGVGCFFVETIAIVEIEGYLCFCNTRNSMETLTIRDFRNNMASSFNIVDAGGSVYIRRRNKTYAVVLVDDDDSAISPSLQSKIDQARQNYRDGKCVTVKTHEGLDAYLNSL